MNTATANNYGTYSVTIPPSETKRFKQLIHLMGWHYSLIPVKKQARLYDPETGDYLSEKTMKVIEDARQGKGIEHRGSAEDFKRWAEAL
jgi:hypothetical protein